MLTECARTPADNSESANNRIGNIDNVGIVARRRGREGGEPRAMSRGAHGVCPDRETMPAVLTTISKSSGGREAGCGSDTRRRPARPPPPAAYSRLAIVVALIACVASVCRGQEARQVGARRPGDLQEVFLEDKISRRQGLPFPRGRGQPPFVRLGGPDGGRVGVDRVGGTVRGGRPQEFLPPIRKMPPRERGGPLNGQNIDRPKFGEPEIYLTRPPAGAAKPGDQQVHSEDFDKFDSQNKQRRKDSSPVDDQDKAGSSRSTRFRRPEVTDWSAKVAHTTDNKQVVNLDTKYFSLSYPEAAESTTSQSGVIHVTGRPGLVLRKVKGRMKTTTSDPTPPESSTQKKKYSDLCDGNLIECQEEEETAAAGNSTDGAVAIGSSLPSYEDIAKHFKQEIWVIPVLIAAGIIVIILVVFEIFLLSKSINRNPSRRHLFLGQMLLTGLLACAGMSVVYTLKPTAVTCAVIRLGSGLAYSLVYSTLLVKLVFLISLNSGVYLPATYQSLLLCFAVLIQLVIGIQWLVSAPPDVSDQLIDKGKSVVSCSTLFKQQLLGLLYVVFLILVVVVLAFKSRGVRENYREAMYVGLTMGFTVAIWIVWVLAGLIVPTQFQDVCSSCGLIACTSITFVIMFMPKGRQLSAMGKEGVYAEDRTDVYTGSGTGSTGSSGTPSPSFFPVKPGKLVHHYRDSKDREFKERQLDRDRLDTPPTPHKHPFVNSTSTRGSHGDLFHEGRPVFHGRGRSTSPRPSHMFGHPLFRSSQQDLVRASHRDRHRTLWRAYSSKDLTRSDPVRSSRRRHTDGSRSREILATISPRKLPSCHRCLAPGLAGRYEDNIYTSLEALHSPDRYPFKSKPSKSNPNVLFRRASDMPSGILY